MTNPTENFTMPAAGSCEAFQWEISQALDERRTFSTTARAHLSGCAQCAAFAEAWGDESGLTGLLAQAPAHDPAVTERLIQAALLAEAPATFVRPRRAATAPWLRWAAVLALGAIGWWLLDPQVAPTPTTITTASHGDSPALAMNRQMARLEQPLAREQAALQGAAADGFAHVRQVLDWSSNVLQ